MNTKVDYTRDALTNALEKLNLERTIDLKDFYRLQEDVNELLLMWQDDLEAEKNEHDQILESIEKTGSWTSKDGGLTIH